MWHFGKDREWNWYEVRVGFMEVVKKNRVEEMKQPRGSIGYGCSASTLSASSQLNGCYPTHSSRTGLLIDIEGVGIFKTVFS